MQVNLSFRMKRADLAILISNKADIQKSKIIRDKEGYYIIKGQTLQQDIILNLYAPKNRASK